MTYILDIIIKLMVIALISTVIYVLISPSPIRRITHSNQAQEIPCEVDSHKVCKEYFVKHWYGNKNELPKSIRIDFYGK